MAKYKHESISEKKIEFIEFKIIYKCFMICQ